MCTKNNKWLSGKERGVQDRRKEARENSRCRNTLSFPAFARARKRKGREKKGASSPHFHFSKSFPSFSSSSQFWTSHRHMAGHAFAWASVCWKMIDARTVQAGHLHKFSFFGTGRTLDWTFSPLSPFWERWRRRRRMVPCLWWLAKKRGKEGRRRRRRRQSINHLSYSTIPCPTAAPFFQGEGPALRAMYANLGGLPLTGEKGTDGAKVGKETPPKKFSDIPPPFFVFSLMAMHMPLPLAKILLFYLSTPMLDRRRVGL